MEILFSFKTTGNENATYIFEIKYLNLPQEAPKSDKYKWFIYSNNYLRLLEFKAMDSKTRNFQCGLFLDIENLKLSQNETTKDIIKCSEEDKDYIMNLLKA